MALKIVNDDGFFTVNGDMLPKGHFAVQSVGDQITIKSVGTSNLSIQGNWQEFVNSADEAYDTKAEVLAALEMVFLPEVVIPA